MRNLFFALIILPFCFFAESNTAPAPVRASQNDPVPLQWNRYTTKNFEILSLDDAQGKYLYYNIEYIKTWLLWRWGMKDVDFPTGSDKNIIRCKVIAVPSREIYTRLFNKKESTWKAEIKDGKVEGVIWIITEEQKWNTAIPMQLTEVVLANFENSYQTKFPVWCRRGMSILNSRFSDIRANLKSEVNSKYVLEMTPETYIQLTPEQRAVYDSQATMFCLWLRKENSGKYFLDFLSASMTTPQAAMQVIGFSNYSDLDQKLKVYLPKLGNVPNDYLTW